MDTPAGWHPDPQDPTRWRWWDGERWTEHTSSGDVDDDAVDDPWGTASAEPVASTIAVSEADEPIIDLSDPWASGEDELARPARRAAPSSAGSGDLGAATYAIGRAQASLLQPASSRQVFREDADDDDRTRQVDVPLDRLAGHADLKPPQDLPVVRASSAPAATVLTPSYWALLVLVVTIGFSIGFFVL